MAVKKESPKVYVERPEKLSGGHRLCAGCGAPVILRQVLMGAGDHHVVVSNATGCVEVSTTIYPYTAWKDSYIHSAFENAAATISGVEAAYKSLKRQGKIDEEVKLLSVAGDGGSYDIGLQAISGALERYHDIVILCYDNGAYMNTGFQRSAATPKGAWTTTSPVGKVKPGKGQQRKNLTEIAVAHGIPYVAQASPHNFRDLIYKAEKAFNTPGPAFLNVLSPCPRGWRSKEAESIQLAKAMVQSNYWPLYEVENGVYKINYDPKKRKIGVEEWMKRQGRFRHLFTDENKWIVEETQQMTDEQWERLNALVEATSRFAPEGGGED
ncbi:MAG: thiamine pyrophosphate-dependent enzyme [Thermoleophilia bacterium]